MLLFLVCFFRGVVGFAFIFVLFLCCCALLLFCCKHCSCRGSGGTIPNAAEGKCSKRRPPKRNFMSSYLKQLLEGCVLKNSLAPGLLGIMLT